jgi:hypothetical protein
MSFIDRRFQADSHFSTSWNKQGEVVYVKYVSSAQLTVNDDMRLVRNEEDENFTSTCRRTEKDKKEKREDHLDTRIKMLTKLTNSQNGWSFLVFCRAGDTL